MATESGYYRHPTIHGDTIVFVCEDDLWTTTVEGGAARRLTANPGRISFPVLSPDGKHVAFTGADDGPEEVYVMDAAGGEPRRLTWLGCMTHTAGWRPDGKAILFASAWRQFMPGFFHLHAVGVQGGVTRPLDVGPARAISYEASPRSHEASTRGKGVVIGRNSGDPARWKRYRGGTAGTLWVDRSGKGSFKPLIRLEGNLASPMWIGSRIYFLSDHEGHGNLYSCTPTGRGLVRHTHHEDFYVRFPRTDGRRIVYHAGADLFVFDPKQDEARKVPVRVASSRPGRNRRFVPAAKHLEHFDVHPEGHSVALVARGGAFTMGLWDGAPYRHGVPSKERHRLATWLPDGTSLLTVCDKGGEESLVVQSADGRGSPRAVKGDLGRILDLAVAPAGATPRVACTNHRQELLLVDLKNRKFRKVDDSRHFRIEGMAWSPDGRYLAYAYPQSESCFHIRVLDTTSGRIRPVTRPDFRDVAPAFDPEGRYLYFISLRDYNPVYDALYFDLGFPRGARPYAIPLRRDLPSPFDDARRAPRAPEPKRPPPPKGEDKKKAPKVTIHFDGIEDRVVAFPVPEGRYTKVLARNDRVLFSSWPIEGALDVPWPPHGPPPAKGKLEAWDLEHGKLETVYAGISDFRLSADGSALGVQIGDRLRVLRASTTVEGLPKASEPGPASGWLDLDRPRVEVRPGDEWRQMFHEAWRLQRDHFWTPDMSGVDWAAVHDAYLPLVDRAACRSEFSDVIWEMQGELGTSHSYEMGGDYAPTPAWHQGFLGADLEYLKKSKTWRVKRIPRGDSWDAKARSPLAEPGVRVAEGDEIVAVGGTKVGPKCSPHECLLHRAKSPLPVTVRRATGKTETVVVTPLASEFPLRYRDWVEGNRERVHGATNGRVGYVHVPDMGPRGFSEFHRYFLHEVEKDGLVIDVRFNGGGHVSQLLLQKLLRKRIAYDQSRWGSPTSYPAHAPMGPMVALTNEYAGSDGDIFSHSFKAYGLGPLIGTRTWGGVIGIWPRHALVDGAVTTQPEFSTWFMDVGWSVENYGTDPDIEVEVRPQDYAAGKDPQLERGIAEIKGILRREKPRRPEFGERPDLKPPRLSDPRR